ncbi:putative PEP-binding protein [Crocosphaera sp. XPORK-15E]|uniref:putative PEP-binding protein n=1 Tax=Crocosphaera sp. XPORK-15E TaxID=3110247 RepID=UPI002B2065E7|nr:putative PEP-binding protein [Crocosphaera sp. XPORK-15E]MEA5532527.1 putative PEP-binding protein [Crocosphaera sp. XPORK-15E]
MGEKAWMLSQLAQSGHPVFPGFVISSTVFRQFLENLNDVSSLLADFPTSSLYLDVDNPRALQLVAQQSRQAILSAAFPMEWHESLGEATAALQASSLILRASLSGPFPPQQDFSGLTPAQLCDNSPQNLELAIKQLWAQLLSAKSLFYWQRLGIRIDQLNFAILVQPMVQAIASGTGTNYENYWEIQGNWGLGYSLLQGEILPDHWEIEPLTGAIIKQEIGNKIRAYRLKVSPENPDSTDSCLEPYLLSNEEQGQYCLDLESLTELWQLIKRLQDHQIYWESLEWIKLESGDRLSSSWAIAQLLPSLSTQRTSLITQHSSINPSQSQLMGIGAAPGRIHGKIYLLTQESIPETTQLTGSIIVTQKIHPFQLSWLKQAAGVITEDGGMTSHAAILARELGIPAVVGVSGVTTWLQTGDEILLDGNKGSISLNTIDESNMSQEKPLLLPEKITYNYPLGTKLMVNLSQPSSLLKVIDLPIDGLGLVRSELMLLDLCSPASLTEWLQDSKPSEIVEKLKQRISQFAEFFAPHPIFYRTFDDKFSTDQDRRGTLGYQLDSTLFRLELQALAEVYQQVFPNLNLILPFVRTVEEFRFCRHLVEEFNLIPSDSFQLWIMAEVPGVIFQLSDYVQAGVQGVAIGTNDLVPLLLGIERDHPLFNETSFPCSSAILGALKALIQQAKALNIPCSICGQLIVQSPQIIEQLVQWGITTISVEPEAVAVTYQAIARAEHRLILEWARERSLRKKP